MRRALFLALVLAPCSHSGLAATFTVDSTIDAVDAAPGDGVCATAASACTLRAAIQEANALAGADTIVLPAGTYTLTIPGMGEDASATGDLDIGDDLTLSGAGAASTVIDAHGIEGVLHVTGRLTSNPPSPIAVDVSGVTIQHGVTGAGGGIYNTQSTLVLTGVVVRANAAGSGGGIYNYTAGLTLIDCTVTENVASDAGGGGIFTYGGGSIQHTTISANVTHGDGGGIYGVYGPIVSNSTISGNRAGRHGGGLFVLPYIAERLHGVTITRNVAGVEERGGGGGGLFVDTHSIYPPDNPYPAETDLGNSIVADNSTADGTASDCAGDAITSKGYDLIGTLAGCAVAGDTTGNIVGDAMLGPLQDNGGPTKTHLPLPGSPALDAANPALPGSGGDACDATDQRAVPRPVGSRCDIGATESGCGNHILEAGEQCDDGNVVTGDGCDANCTPTGCGNGVVGPGEACDDGASNGVDQCCSATCTLVDADGDGLCDRDDPCAGSHPISSHRGLVITKLATLPGDDRLAMQGDVLVPFPFSPPLDPLDRGLRFVLRDANGVVLDETVLGRYGWKRNGAGTVTTFVQPPYSLLKAGVVRASVRDRSASVPGLVRFAVKAKNLALPSPSLTGVPLRATIVFDIPSTDSGQCGDATLTCDRESGTLHCR